MFRGSLRILAVPKNFRKSQQYLLRRALTTQLDIIVQSPFKPITIPEQTIDQYIWDNVSSWSSKPAMVDGIDGRKFTYGQIRDHSRALAVRLQKNFNLKRGDVVAVCVLNSIEFPVMTLGAIEASLIVTTVNPVYTAEEIARQLIDSDTKLLFGQAFNYKVLEKAVKLTKKPIKIVYTKLVQSESIPTSGIDFQELIETSGLDFSDFEFGAQDPREDVALLPYSSGTTGLSKGVQLTHRNIVSNCEMANADYESGTVYETTTETHQDVIPCVLPFFHIYGLTVTLLSKLRLGCKIVSLPSFKPDTFLNVLAEHKATVLMVVPPIVNFMGQNEIEEKHIASLKIVTSGAAPVCSADAARLLKKIPNIPFIQGYGLTETSPIAMLSFQADNINYETVGRPVSLTEAKIVAIDDESFTGVGPNITGELFLRGPNIMKGYHNNEEATKETIIDGGWLRTGDIGYYDERKFFFITDRLKELIKVKGFQVPPLELENVLKNHPKILDAGVIGVQDDKSGELPRAYVVLQPNEEMTEEEIKEFVAKKVAYYKKLDGGVEFIESIPKNTTGKILRRTLKEKFEASI